MTAAIDTLPPAYDAALAYADRGLRVLPLWSAPGGICACPKGGDCVSPGKHPAIGKGGVYTGTTTPATLQAWARTRPEANLGLVTGNGLIVIDVDGPAGERELAELESEHGAIPKNVIVTSGRTDGGRHIYLAIPEGVEIGNPKLTPNIDVRGQGGYVVAPPSRHASGAHYVPNVPLETAEFPDAPTWLVDRLVAKSAKRATERPVDASGGISARVAALIADQPKLAALWKGEGKTKGDMSRSGYDASIAATLASFNVPLDEIASAIAARPGAHRDDPAYASSTASRVTAHVAERRESQMLRGDQVEMAERLLVELEHGGDLVKDEGRMHRYDRGGGVWRELRDDHMSRIVQSFAGCPVGEKMRPLKVKRSDVSGAIALAGDRVARDGFFANAAPGIAFANGFAVVTPEGVERHEHGPDNRARFSYQFPFTPGAAPSAWLDFLGDVWRDDEDREVKVQVLREFLGAAIIGQGPKFQRCLVEVGEGSNGKGVVSKVATACLPPEAVVSIAPQAWGGEYYRAQLAGKRLNVVAELPEADIIDSESFKAIVAGDDVSARRIREAPFTLRPKASHLFSANRLPGTRDQTHGFWRRWIVLTFDRVFAEHEQDPGLADRLIATERPAIVAWALEGAVSLLERGCYLTPASSRQAAEEWRANADQVSAFVTELYEPTAASEADTPAARLYRAYRLWAEDNGHRPLASNKFAARMKALGHGARHTRTGNVYPVTLRRSS